MSRIPPNLLYLTIYNPTLQPLGPVPDDDEDAEEQAHILFYTAKERAVSRDRMLRQVGLAKALVNFSDMFNSADICNNVHSQSKRLIMVSPEPDFWIHAGVEVAKMPRAPPDKDKAKSKDRSKSNEKGKGKATETIPLYDYQEGSVHDLALRADILRGYEQFKLTHGSFTSILSEIGKEGLELQLERFFTVWAWSWNLEDGAEFGEHLGIPLHPSFPLLRSTLDNYTQRLPNRTSLLLIKPPYVVPSPQYSTAKHPTSLIRHLLSLIPPTPPVSEVASRDGTIKGRQPSDGEAPNGKDPPTTGSFLGIPAVNMNVKWGWPAALTFGKGPSKRPALESNLGADENKEAGPVNNHSDASSPSKEITELDQHTLKDAISTDASSIASEANEDPPTQITDADQTQALMPELDATDELDTAPDTIKHPQIHQNRMPADVDPATSRSEATTGEEHTNATLPLPVFSSINVHLASSDNPLLTHRQKVYYITNDRAMLAFIGVEEDTISCSPDLPQSAVALLDDIETLLSAELSKTLTLDQLPTLSKILQPTDTHIVSTGQFTISSPNFLSKSSYLYDAQELQASDPDISEVFSRGLNPQHWHIARRGLNITTADEDGTPSAQEVYMQIFRKEASLSDVDNVLASVVRRNGLVDGAV